MEVYFQGLTLKLNSLSIKFSKNKCREETTGTKIQSSPDPFSAKNLFKSKREINLSLENILSAVFLGLLQRKDSIYVMGVQV